MESDIPEPAHRKTIGRPRRLTLDIIVDAACEIGIAQLDMGLLAERLNTGVGTLYGYVRGRDHLLELVAQRLAGSAMVKDRGQSWQEIMREHAAVTFALFESLPQLITNLIVGDADQASASYAELILDMLVSRGLSRRNALDLYLETSQVVLGAAIFLIRRKAITGTTVDTEGNPVPLPALLGDYRPTLERIIVAYEGLAPERQEAAHLI